MTMVNLVGGITSSSSGRGGGLTKGNCGRMEQLGSGCMYAAAKGREAGEGAK